MEKMNRQLYGYLCHDEAVMESLTDLRMAQPPKDRLHYFDVALEGSAEANANLLQRLYIDVVSKSNIDFGSIPDSRGNFRKYNGYRLMEDSITRLNQLYEGIPSDNMKRLNGLYDMIISCQKDFEYGFSYDIELIQILYNTSVMSLHEMIGVCLFEYNDSLKAKAGNTFNFSNSKKKDLLITKNVDSLIKAYKNGQFQTMMKEFKKNPNLLSTTKIPATAAEEANLDGAAALVEGIKYVADKAGGAKDAIANAISEHPAIAIPIIAVGAFILLIIIIRNLIYLFWSKSISADEYLKAEKEILDIEIENEKVNGAPEKRIKSYRKFSDKLQRLSDFIEVKILHNDKKAKEELKKSNKENYTKNSLGSSPAFSTAMQF